MVASQVEWNRIQFGDELWSPQRKYYLLTASAPKSLLRSQKVLSENEFFQPGRTVNYGKPKFRVIDGEAGNAGRIIFERFGGMT